MLSRRFSQQDPLILILAACWTSSAAGTLDHLHDWETVHDAQKNIWNWDGGIGWDCVGYFFADRCTVLWLNMVKHIDAHDVSLCRIILDFLQYMAYTRRWCSADTNCLPFFPDSPKGGLLCPRPATWNTLLKIWEMHRNAIMLAYVKVFCMWVNICDLFSFAAVRSTSKTCGQVEWRG